MAKRKKARKKPRKVRDWIALNAWYRHSGAFKNKKRSIKKQRQWKQKRKDDEG